MQTLRRIVLLLCLVAAFSRAEDFALDALDKPGIDLETRIGVVHGWIQLLNKKPELCSDARVIGIKKRFAELRESDRNLLPIIESFFRALKEPSPECLAFCHAILTSADPILAGKQQQAAGLLVAVGAKDDPSVQALLKCVDTSREPVYVFETIVKHFAEHPLIRPAVLAWAKSGKTRQRVLAINALKSFNLLPDERAEIAVALAEFLEKDAGPETQAAARSFLTFVEASPSDFVGCLNAEQTAIVLRALKSSKDPKVVAMLAAVLFSGCLNPPEELIDVMLLAFGKDKIVQSGMLRCLGFMPASQNPELIQKILSASPDLPGEAKCGLFSLYMRSGGDLQFIAQEKLDPSLKNRAPLGSHYWQFLVQSRMVVPLEPAKWQDALKSARRVAVANSIASYPNAPETAAAVDQIITDPQLADDRFLTSLWRVRHNGAEIAKAKQLKAWLEKKSQDSNSVHDAMLAVSLLFNFYGEKDFALRWIAQAYEKDPDLQKRWTPALDTLIDIDPEHERMTTARAALFSEPFLCWLLDLRCGKSVKRPPQVSLAFSLRLSQPFWLESLADCGKSTYPWLKDLRFGPICIISAKSGFENPMAYMGVLDRLEMQQRGITLP